VIVETRLDTDDVEGFELVTNGLHRLSPDTVAMRAVLLPRGWRRPATWLTATKRDYASSPGTGLIDILKEPDRQSM